jgi:hypothetical protein
VTGGCAVGVAAGYPVVAILQHVPVADRQGRTAASEELGVAAVVGSREHVERLLR